MSDNKSITPEWLESRGFIRVTKDNKEDVEGAWDLDVDAQPEDYLYIEGKLDRKQFAILLKQQEYTDGLKFFDFEVYIRDDIGCGFTAIPNQFCEMTEYHFSLLFEAIRRETL